MALPTLAQQRLYTLDECRSMALVNNVSVRNAANSVKAAREERKSAFTHYFPVISASGMGFNANKGLLQLEMEPGATMNLLKNGVMGGVTAVQPIFMGGQIVNGNRLAGVGVQVSELKQELSTKEVTLTAEQYYWQVVTLQEKLKTLTALESQLSTIHKDVQTAVNAGVTTRNDLLQVNLRLNDVASTRVTVENGLSLSRRLLAQYIGAETDTIAVADEIDMAQTPTFPEELRRNHEEALPQTTEYRLLDRQVKASKIQQQLTVGKTLPSVSVGAGYMYDNLMDKAHPFGVGFVSVSVPLSDWWGNSHSIRQKKLETKNACNQLADNSQLLVIGMQKAWDDLEEAYRQLLIAHNSIEQSTENLRLNQDYYRAGTSTMSDLLDAQSLYQQSRDKYADAYAQLRIRAVEYRQATGQE
jgi:outer membrane protein TolC